MPGTDLAFWDERETSLSRNAPDEGNPGGFVLEGGPGNTILIRFGGLDAFRGRIKGAKLRLHVSDGKPQVQSVDRLLRPWSEGPLPLPAYLKRQLVGAEGAIGATWRQSRDGARWGSDGAAGGTDAEQIVGATPSQPSDEWLEIDGLADAVAKMAARPSQNFGFALRFQRPVSFDGSRSLKGRPTLVLTLDPAQADRKLWVSPVEVTPSARGWHAKATLWNLSAEPAKSLRYSWSVGGKALSMVEAPAPLGAGSSLALESDFADAPNGAEIGCFATDGASTDEAFGYAGGQSVSVSGADSGSLRAAAEYANGSLLPRSQYTFAREGVVSRWNVSASGKPSAFASSKEQVRSLLLATGLKDLRPKGFEAYGGGFLGGESRMDSLLAGLPLLPEPYYTPVLETSIPEATGLLGMAHVAQLNGVAAKGGVIAILRPVGLSGQALSACKIDVVDELSGVVLAKDKPLDKDALLLEIRDPNGLAERRFTVTGRLGGESASTTLFGYQLTDQRLRSRLAIPVLDVPLNLADETLNEVDHAKGRPVTGPDGADLKAPELGGKAGTFAEIDLGRDRTVGAVSLEGVPWRRFQLLTYETGGSPKEALVWFEEVDGLWRAGRMGGALRYRLPARKFRYLRIVSKEDQAPARLDQVRLMGATVAP